MTNNLKKIGFVFWVLSVFSSLQANAQTFGYFLFSYSRSLQSIYDNFHRGIFLQEKNAEIIYAADSVKKLQAWWILREAESFNLG